MQKFTELKVWRKAHAMALDVYRLTATFPGDERYGLTSQLRRAVVSIPTNVAEGSKRRWGQEYARFINIAEASLAEVQYLLLLSRDLGYATADRVERIEGSAAEAARMLHGLRLRVESES